MLSSKKFWFAVIGVIAEMLLYYLKVPIEVSIEVGAITVALIFGQAIADKGKEAEKIKLGLKIILFMFLFTSYGCASAKHFKYLNDSEFLSSGEAGAYEQPFVIDGMLCQKGHCVKQIKKNLPLINFKLIPENYAFTFYFDCASPVNINFSKDIIKDYPYKFAITKKHYQDLNSFTCVGTFSPHDRTEPITKKFYLKVLLVDSDYLQIGEPYQIKYKNFFGRESNLLILGRFAYKTSLLFNGKIKHLNKRTVYKLPKKKLMGYV